MKSSRRQRFNKNEDNEDYHLDADISENTASSTSDFSDNDDKEKFKGSHRHNKSKLSTNIVPSFLDEILREIDETQNLVEKENPKKVSTPTSSITAKYFDENSENCIHSTDNKFVNQASQSNHIVSSFISDLNNANDINSSNLSKPDFITSPIINNNEKKKSIATSPFKPPLKRQAQEQTSQEVDSQHETITKPYQIQNTTIENLLQEEGQDIAKPEQTINESEPKPNKKTSVTIIYPQKSPQAQQRRQHEIDLLNRAKQQEQQNRPKKNQQLILINEQQKIIHKPGKSILKETKKDEINFSRNSIQNKFPFDSIQDSKQAQKKNKNESKTVYVPPLYEKKLSSLFDIVSSESDEPFTHDHLLYETSQAEMHDAFVFNVHEEGGRLYLFCKYLADPTQFGTICICFTSPSLFLQFLPAFDVSDDNVEKEIEEIAKLCNGEIISKKWLTKRSINSEREQKYLEVEFSSKFNVANVPIKGKTYEAAYGSTLSLSDHLMIRKNLKGAKWISVRCAQSPHSQTSIPMYTTLNPFDIEVAKEQMAKPSMNICIFSMFERNGEVFMVTMRIFYQCNYETLDNYRNLNSARKSIITFIYAQEILKSSFINDRTTMYCDTEAELLLNFAERIEQFDIDIICSYDLVKHDLPFILERMKVNNMKQWSKIGRHVRTVYPKKDSSLSLITSGRMLLDIKSSFKNLLHIDSDSFSSLVQTELEIDRPILDFDKGSFCFTDQKQMQELISFNRKDTHFIKKIIDNKNIIALSEHIARVTGCQWSQIMSEPPASIIETLLLLYLHKKNFIIPDKKQQNDKYIFEPFETKPGLYNSLTALISCDFFTAKIIQRKNFCFTTLDQLRSEKSKSIFPNMIAELLNTFKKLTQIENETEASQASIYQKTLFRDSLNIILNLIKPYFEYGSQRFPISPLGKIIDTEIHKIINSFEGNIILVASQSDFNSFIIEYGNNQNSDINDNDNNIDEIDEIISHANSGLKHFGFEVSEKYSRLLVLSNCGSSEKTDSNSISFLGIDKKGERKPHNFNFYRYDWCPATKILVDNAFRILMSSNDAENELITLFKEFPDINRLEPSDFAIATLPLSAQIISLIKNKIQNSQKTIKNTVNLNPNKAVLRRVADDSDSDSENHNQQNHPKFLSSYDDDDAELEYVLDAYETEFNMNKDSLNLNSQLYKIMKMYEEKGKFINIEGKITYIRCLNNEIKNVEAVDAIDNQIDIDWYKKNQFFDAMKLILKPFSSIISTPQLLNAFLSFENNRNDDNFVEINNDNNDIRLLFNCFNCNQKNVFNGINDDCLKCQNCGIRFNWKYVANSLTFCIYKLIEKWSKNEIKCNYYLCKQKRGQLQMETFQKHINPCNPTKNCCGNFVFEYSSKDIYEGLLALGDLFDDEGATDDINNLRMHMKQHIYMLKELHSFTNMKLSALLSTPNQPSDTQVINDVCSFLDD